MALSISPGTPRLTDCRRLGAASLARLLLLPNSHARFELIDKSLIPRDERCIIRFVSSANNFEPEVLEPLRYICAFGGLTPYTERDWPFRIKHFPSKETTVRSRVVAALLFQDEMAVLWLDWAVDLIGRHEKHHRMGCRIHESLEFCSGVSQREGQGN